MHVLTFKYGGRVDRACQMVIMVEIEKKKKKESRGSFELEMGCPVGLLGAECNYYSFYYVISVFLI